MSVAIKVPPMGESVTEATVAKWLKNVGDTVKADELLVELETDKVTVEVVAPASGTIAEIAVKTGGNVGVGGVLGSITEGAVASAPSPVISVPVTAAPVQQSTIPSAAPVMPAAARMAAENNINPDTIDGTGKGGRVTKEDVVGANTRVTKDDILNALSGGKAAVPAASAVAPAAPRATGPREERVKMTRLRQSIAKRLKEAQNTAAMLTTFNEVDMTAVMELRSQYNEAFQKKYGVKVGFMSLFVKACIQALREIPAVNAEIAGDEIIYKNYYDIGVAVSAPQGLMVPVVRGADVLDLAGIEKEIAALAVKARDGKLTVDEMSGGTFTITNGGTFGSLMSTPILNAPQSAILGMHKIQERPMVVGGKVEVRPMMYVALSYDHRIIDGREAVTFLVRVKECLEDPQRLLLAV